MPLLFCKPFAQTGLLGLWEIGESPADLAPRFRGSPLDWVEYEGLSLPQKKREFLASRVLVEYLSGVAGLPYRGLTKDEWGKPSLLYHPAWHVSITHSTRYAAAVLHPSLPVGIDIEAVSEKLRRVAGRILSADELAHAHNDPHRLAVYWTGKEALYKLYGKRGLFFSKHLRLEPFADEASEVVGWILTEGERQQCRIVLSRVGEEVLAVGYAVSA